MNRPELITKKRADIPRLAALHGAHNVRLFGSIARGQADALSDVDILVDWNPAAASWTWGVY